MIAILKRIIFSKKSVLATFVLLVDIAAVWGFDVPAEQITTGIVGVFNGLGALLIVGQSVIDAVNGSPSDAANGSG